MNERERFLATLRFERPDRVPFTPGGGRRSTRQRWKREGLPADVRNIHAYIQQLIGIEVPKPTQPVVGHGIVTTMMPEFEERVIEERPDSRIVQDWKGNVCEIGKEFGPSDLRGAPDFCTRSWLKLPVESRDDWPDMARRYDPDQPGRFPEDFDDRCRILRDRDYAVTWVFTGPFWQLREWCGFEGLCMLMLDDPGFVEEMVDFWERYIAGMLERALDRFTPDSIMIQEDMAYKEKPMVGPQQCRRFLSRCWTRWGRIIREAGVPIYEVDSDGHVGLLMDEWIAAGVNCNSPLEVAAGNDLPALRRKYGKAMAYRGGVDKRAIAAGGQTLRDEIDRLRPVIDGGGYIPGCDHAVPSDVSWPNFVEYCRLLADATGWLHANANR